MKIVISIIILFFIFLSYVLYELKMQNISVNNDVCHSGNTKSSKVDTTPVEQNTPPPLILPNTDKKRFEDVDKSLHQNIINEINFKSRIARILPLSETKLGAQDRVIRIWVGFGLAVVRGFSLKHQDNVWSGDSLNKHFSTLKEQNKESLTVPKSGWEFILKYMERNNVYEAIQSPEKDKIFTDPDEEFIVVESKVGNDYKVRIFNNSRHHNTSRGKIIINFCRTIEDEFDVFLGC